MIPSKSELGPVQPPPGAGPPETKKLISSASGGIKLLQSHTPSNASIRLGYQEVTELRCSSP